MIFCKGKASLRALALWISAGFIFGGCGRDQHSRAAAPQPRGLELTGRPSPPFGWLRVQNGRLTGEDGNPARLSGMSSHGIAWYPQFVNESLIRWLTADWKINVYRAAMVIDPDKGGYIADRSQKELVIRAVDAAIKMGIYVLIDWHVLFNGDPNAYREQAKDFFREMATRYANSPNVIFEICNEPNGDNVHWANKIKPYAMDVIAVIRAIAPNNIILVGTGTWSQDVHEPAADPLPFSNIMYVAHFYAGSHKQWLRDRIEAALAVRTPIFVSEWGVSEGSGDGGPYMDEAQRWVDFVNKHELSIINWSAADKNEASAAVRPGSSSQGGWYDWQLTPSGTYARGILRSLQK